MSRRKGAGRTLRDVVDEQVACLLPEGAVMVDVHAGAESLVVAYVTHADGDVAASSLGAISQMHVLEYSMDMPADELGR